MISMEIIRNTCKQVTYGELAAHFRAVEKQGKHAEGYITFSQESFTTPYPEAQRTYHVWSNNKAYQPGMLGYSIYGSAIDGTDPMVRLERYMRDEKGGQHGWVVEMCYLFEEE